MDTIQQVVGRGFALLQRAFDYWDYLALDRRVVALGYLLGAAIWGLIGWISLESLLLSIGSILAGDWLSHALWGLALLGSAVLALTAGVFTVVLLGIATMAWRRLPSYLEAREKCGMLPMRG
jgi:hypothetical protein